MADNERKSERALLHSVLGGYLYLAQNTWSFPTSAYRIFSLDSSFAYHEYCDDFGPLNVSCIVKFIKRLDGQLNAFPTSKIVLLAEPGRRALTNAAFLLGSYMILKLKKSWQEVSQSFKVLEKEYLIPFRDATFSEPDFGLTLSDCWRGLERGIANGWLSIPKKSDDIWGEIDLEEYDQYDDPLNADLHEIVPKKIVAFKGPIDLENKEYHDDENNYRQFSPEHYAKIFAEMGVTDVVRLNEHLYDKVTFTKHGIEHHDLEFQDCTVPGAEVIQSFLRIVDAAKGSVAVHCRAGLGRTGTLIALYMMRSLGFGARDAMGWLRIMRPGCVIGEQQHFLVHVESCLFKNLSQTPPKLGHAGTLSSEDAEINPSRPNAVALDMSKKKRLPRLGSSSTGSPKTVTISFPGLDGADGPQNAGKDTAAAVLAAQVAKGMQRRGILRAATTASCAVGSFAEMRKGARSGKPLPPILPDAAKNVCR